jgi:hypothetical protein
MPVFGFLTGRLAEPALRETLAALPPEIPYVVKPLGITVAALLNTDWTARHLDASDCEVVMIPGLSRMDVAELSRRLGKPVTRGPKDLRDIPAWFGLERVREGYGQHAIQIFAEVNDATRLPDRRILAMATRYQLSGADVIDLGCVPGDPDASRIGALTALLVREGFTVSVDTFDEAEALAGDAAGASYLLSINSTNLDLARDLRAVPVVIPDSGDGVDSLAANVAGVAARGCRRYLVNRVTGHTEQREAADKAQRQGGQTAQSLLEEFQAVDLWRVCGWCHNYAVPFRLLTNFVLNFVSNFVEFDGCQTKLKSVFKKWSAAVSKTSRSR